MSCKEKPVVPAYVLELWKDVETDVDGGKTFKLFRDKHSRSFPALIARLNRVLLWARRNESDARILRIQEYSESKHRNSRKVRDYVTFALSDPSASVIIEAAKIGNTSARKKKRAEITTPSSENSIIPTYVLDAWHDVEPYDEGEEYAFKIIWNSGTEPLSDVLNKLDRVFIWAQSQGADTKITRIQKYTKEEHTAHPHLQDYVSFVLPSWSVNCLEKAKVRRIEEPAAHNIPSVAEGIALTIVKAAVKARLNPTEYIAKAVKEKLQRDGYEFDYDSSSQEHDRVVYSDIKSILQEETTIPENIIEAFKEKLDNDSFK